MLLSLGIAALAAVFVTVTTGAVVRLQKEEAARATAELDRYKSEAAAEVGRAHEGIAKAQVQIAEANQAAAKAGERAAALEKETAQARAEQERLKQMVVWRTIPPAAHKMLTEKLSKRTEAISISVVANDPEAMAFASQISKILLDAKWTGIPSSVSWGNWLPLGLHIYAETETDTVKFLRDAFAEAGVSFDPSSPPRKPDLGIVFQQEVPVSAIILVGSRLGPF